MTKNIEYCTGTVFHILCFAFIVQNDVAQGRTGATLLAAIAAPATAAPAATSRVSPASVTTPTTPPPRHRCHAMPPQGAPAWYSRHRRRRSPPLRVTGRAIPRAVLRLLEGEH